MKRKPARAKRGERLPETSAQPRWHVILYTIAALLALAGLADATYLTVAHLVGEHVACAGTSSCNEVLSSKYATLFGQPLAAYGGVAYFVAFSLATLLAFGHTGLRRYLALTIAVMFLGTLWLLYVQAFVLHAYCTYCLLSAACTFMLAGLVLAVPPRR